MTRIRARIASHCREWLTGRGAVCAAHVIFDSKAAVRLFLSRLAFALIQLGLLPVTVVGYLMFIRHATRQSRLAGVSTTALSPLLARWTYHDIGGRSDAAAKRLALAMPNVSQRAIRWMSYSTRLGMRLTGYVPDVASFPYVGKKRGIRSMFALRTQFFDDALTRYMPQMQQFVILGAGYDTRALSMLRDARLKIFEVDANSTQTLKRATLKQAGLGADHVTFVEVDFNSECCFDKLIASGFNPDLPTFFLWEGVTYYLDGDAVRSTLHLIADRLAAGSIVAFDYFNLDFVENRSLVMRCIKRQLRASGENLRFGIPAGKASRDDAAIFLEQCGMSLLRHEHYGVETAERQPMGGLVVASVGS